MTAPPAVLRPRVLIVGAGPAGLSAARVLGRSVDGEVILVEREDSAGGIPRHSHHTGFATRDLRRVMTGPGYARRLRGLAEAAGVAIRTQAMVTDWAGPTSVNVTTPGGLLRVDAEVILLATGARERPRAARMIPGDRPTGIYTTGHLQTAVHLRHGRVGERAVVVGAELVSWSAVLTLRDAGCATVLMTTQHSSPESYAALNLAGRALLRTPVARRTRVTRVVGHRRLEAVEVEDLDTRRRRMVGCDTLVLTGDWIPDHELARAAGLEIDPGTKGPSVDTALRTSRAGVFAAGNLVHPVETADVAALGGLHAADAIRRWLDVRHLPDRSVPLAAEPPLRWVSPNRVTFDGPAPARRRLLAWSDEHIRRPWVTASQGGRVIGVRRLPWPASPGRAFRIPWSLLENRDPSGDPITIGVY